MRASELLIRQAWVIKKEIRRSVWERPSGPYWSTASSLFWPSIVLCLVVRPESSQPRRSHFRSVLVMGAEMFLRWWHWWWGGGILRNQCQPLRCCKALCGWKSIMTFSLLLHNVKSDLVQQATEIETFRFEAETGSTHWKVSVWGRGGVDFLTAASSNPERTCYGDSGAKHSLLM